MKSSILISIFFYCFQLQAQVGIGTNTPHNTAVLELNSISKGFLAPRMNSSSRTGIVSPATGLLVFDTDVNRFYFYNGSSWVYLDSGSAVPQSVITDTLQGYWRFGGNSVRAGVGDYLGTYNNRSLLFGTNNTLHTGLDSNGYFGIGTISPLYKVHIKGTSDVTQLVIQANASQSNSNPLIRLKDNNGADLMWIHSDNQVNTFIGRYSGGVNNFTGGGSDNTAVGYETLSSNTIGFLNTAVGKRAMIANSTGAGNSAFGAGALQKSNGSNNVAMGYHALWENTNGHNNTAIGTLALVNKISGDQNTAIGYFSSGNGIGNYSNVTAVGSYSLLQSTGSYNTVVGSNTLYNNVTGANNTVMGYGAGYNATGSGNVFLGYLSGYNETGNNKLYISNSVTSSPLIYGDFSTSSLTFNGSLSYKTITLSDADYSVASSDVYLFLPAITGNRIITLPPASVNTGRVLKLLNKNNSGNTWSFGTGVKDASGATLTTLINHTWYHIVSDGTEWIIEN
ncbi:MAG: hypothetical protein J0L56_11090 [Chitinophagales bacterium]|nr:hypothetical protein [Chitinophagales bacterium]